VPTPFCLSSATHAAAAIDEQQNALITLVLEFADDGLTQAQRRLPINVAHGVAIAVFSQLFESVPSPRC